MSQSGAVGTGEGEFLFRYGRAGLLEDAVGFAGGDYGCHCSGMEGLDGSSIGVGWKGITDEVWGNGGKVLGLEGGSNSSGARGIFD